MDQIQIHLLGRFEILVNGKRIDDQLSKSKKGCTLMQYLLLHRNETVSYGELYEMLWPNEESVNPESALKTLVSRMRVILSKYSKDFGSCIATSRGAYSWNMALPCEIDLFEFEAACEKLQQLAPSLKPENRELYRKVLDFYHGDLLPANAQENWVITRSVYLQNKYMDIVYQYLDLLQEAQEYEEQIRVCRHALEINAFDERLHVKLMDALVRTNRNNEALMQYKHATNLHFRYLGMKPPEGIQEFYKQIIRAGQVLDGDIDSIRRELCDYHETSGAFVCEYAVFKEIYNLQVRSNERGTTTMFLALVLVSNADGQPMEALKLDEVMHRLLEVLKSTLRKGDTITHYTPSQYALLLPLKNFDDGKIVMQRIKNVFYKRYPNSSIIINYRIGPIKESPEPEPTYDRRTLHPEELADAPAKAEQPTK